MKSFGLKHGSAILWCFRFIFFYFSRIFSFLPFSRIFKTIFCYFLLISDFFTYFLLFFLLIYVIFYFVLLFLLISAIFGNFSAFSINFVFIEIFPPLVLMCLPSSHYAIRFHIIIVVCDTSFTIRAAQHFYSNTLSKERISNFSKNATKN